MEYSVDTDWNMVKTYLSMLALGLLVCVPEAYTGTWIRIMGEIDQMTNIEEIINKNMESNPNMITEIEMLDNENEIPGEEEKKKMRTKLITEERRIKKKKLSKFELTLVRCCSSSVDREVGRCFEVNGFGGINFLKEPCEHLDSVLKKIKKLNA